MSRAPSLLLVAVVCGALYSLTQTGAAANYFESTQGDLSGDYLAPTPLVLGVGSNLLAGTLAGGSRDLDLFTLAVPVGGELAEIRILDFSGGNAGSFLGLQPGAMLSDDPALGDFFPSAIGFALITPADAVANEDVLDTIVVGPPFFFTRTLPAGEYAGWLNETGAASSYRIDFVVKAVPEMSTGALSCAILIPWLLFRRR